MYAIAIIYVIILERFLQLIQRKQSLSVARGKRLLLGVRMKQPRFTLSEAKFNVKGCCGKAWIVTRLSSQNFTVL